MKSQTEHVADGAKGIKRGEFKSSVSKDRSKPKGKVAEKVKPEKPSAPREPPKKIHRIVIRKLPAREFSEADVQQCLDRVCSTGDIGLIRDAFTLEHFVAGKISRKRGQVTSAAFVAVNDETQFWRFLANCPQKIPFIEAEDAGAQPEIAPASNQKAFKQKDRTDKQLNTFESDPFFLAFSAKLNKTAEKLPSAEVQLDTKKDTSAQTREELIRNNPLLKYMREKAEKKIQERRLLKRGGSSSKSLQVTSVLAKSGSKSVSSSKSGKERSSRSGREKSGREAREAREGGRKGRESKSAPSSGGGGGAGEGAVPIREGGRDPRPPRDGAPREIKEKGGRDRGKGKGRGKDNSGTASGGGQEGGESGGAPMVPKFTIAKRADSSQGQQGAGAGVSGVGGGRGGSGGAPRGDDHADRGHGAGAGGGVGEGNKPLRRENNPSTAEGSGGGAGRGGGRGRGGGGRDGGGGRGPREGRGGGPAQQGHSQGQGQSAPSRV